MMKRKKLAVVFVTRPEATELTPVINILKASEFFRTYIIVTAPHREMLDEVLALFKIKPDYDPNRIIKLQNIH